MGVHKCGSEERVHERQESGRAQEGMQEALIVEDAQEAQVEEGALGCTRGIIQFRVVHGCPIDWGGCTHGQCGANAKGLGKSTCMWDLPQQFAAFSARRLQMAIKCDCQHTDRNLLTKALLG